MVSRGTPGPVDELRGSAETFVDASQVGNFVVFNIAGNKVRMVTRVFYNTKPRQIHIKHVLTHREYDKGDWKA